MRKLATIKQVKDIIPIDGANNIEIAKLNDCGWQCVVKKGEFKVGDRGVYFEIDSFLPEENPVFDFLKNKGVKTLADGSRGYRLRTMKLRNVISQGLLLPLNSFSNIGLPIQDDLTEYLNIKLYEPPIPAQLAGKVKGSFPAWIQKTDQERIQNLPEFFTDLKDESFEATEKLDGCLDENSIIETRDGEKTIKEICDTKYTGKVKSLDLNENEIVWRHIKNHSIIESDDNTAWYELEIENGNKLKLTGNHRIWLPKLNCYRRVDELNGDEEILLKK